jgi:hypothetical protein
MSREERQKDLLFKIFRELDIYTRVDPYVPAGERAELEFEPFAYQGDRLDLIFLRDLGRHPDILDLEAFWTRQVTHNVFTGSASRSQTVKLKIVWRHRGTGYGALWAAITAIWPDVYGAWQQGTAR